MVTPCIWLETTHTCNPPHYGLWVILYFFTICMYKHCFLPLLLVFVVKCCVKMYCSLPHNPYCCSLPSPAHLHMYQFFTHCLPTIICVMLLSFCIFWMDFISLLLHSSLCVFAPKLACNISTEKSVFYCRWTLRKKVLLSSFPAVHSRPTAISLVSEISSSFSNKGI